MVDEVSPDELESLLDAENPPAVVDVRDPREFEREHIPDSTNVPFDDLLTDVESLAGEDHVVTVCPHGVASVQAALLLESYKGLDGADVESLAGGLESWDGDLVGADAHD